MSPLFIEFLLSIALLTAFDAVWFTAIMGKFFVGPLSHLLSIRGGHVTLRWFPAIIEYVLLALGIVFFVLPVSGILSGYPMFVRGAVFGTVVFGVHEGTNGALMKDWPTSLIVADILWGLLACGVTAEVVHLFVR